jgi:hypothetical protein
LIQGFSTTVPLQTPKGPPHIGQERNTEQKCFPHGTEPKKKGEERHAEQEAEEQCQATIERYGKQTKGRVHTRCKKGSVERIEEQDVRSEVDKLCRIAEKRKKDKEEKRRKCSD